MDEEDVDKGCPFDGPWNTENAVKLAKDLGDFARKNLSGQDFMLLFTAAEQLCFLAEQRDTLMQALKLERTDFFDL